MLTPRWYQQEALDAFSAHMCTTPGNPLIVLPTGAGKSLVNAMVCKWARGFQGRVLCLAHRKELIQQNADKAREWMPDLDIGVYSAGLKQRDIDHDIIFAGIQSVADKAHLFGRRHMVVVDEAHLIPTDGEGRYRSFLKDLGKLNPNLRVGGLTATPFRTGEGKLYGPKAIFQTICYSAPMMRLIEEGFLSRLSTVPIMHGVDTSQLHVRAGEFKADEMTALFEGEEKINAACTEIVMKTIGRKSTLVFCPGVFHAEATRKKLEQLTGEECGIVVGDTPPMERASTLERLKNGKLKRCVNVDVLTTGFDAPCIDAIAVLRATMSPGLFAQICGRGLRISPQKTDCLILDFGENLKRHGPLDSDSYGTQSEGRGKGMGDGDAPTKVCPSCEKDCPISARECECGWAFPPPEIVKHGTNADGSPIFEKDVVPDEWIVESVSMSRNRGKEGKQDTLRVDYVCKPSRDGFAEKTISEWVCLEHEGYAAKKASLWWAAHSLAPVAGIDDAIALFNRGAWAAPTALTTRPDGRYTKIISAMLDERPTEWREATAVVSTDGFDAEYDDVPF